MHAAARKPFWSFSFGRPRPPSPSAYTIAGNTPAEPPVGAVTVRVRKPEAPLPGALAWAGVEIRRSR